MPYCGPVCAVPSCASSPVVGFGSRGLGCGGLGYGLGSRWGLGCGYGYGSGYGLGYGSGYGLGYGSGYGLGYGSGYGLGSGAVTPAANLGVLAGVQPSPINQLPTSEVTIQPPAFVVTMPGPILSASCEGVAVGGYTPCAPSGSAYSAPFSSCIGYRERRFSIC